MGDTVLRRFLTNWVTATSEHVSHLGGRCLVGDDVVAADLGRPSAFFNVAILLRPLDIARLDDVANALDGVYGRPDTSGEAFLFSPWPTPDLRPYGWSLIGHPPLMLRPAGGPPPPPVPGLVIEQVSDEGGLATLGEVAAKGYPLPEVDLASGPVYSPLALGDPRWRFWLGWADARAVAATIVFVDAGINDVVLVATLPDSRRRGFGEALTWRATLADPALPALLLASDEGRPVYERMGYLPMFRFTGWVRSRPVA